MEDDSICTYCGATAECREHVIPVVFFSITRNYENDKSWLVPACNTCNNLAGTGVFFSIPEKTSYILKRFKIKYKKIINQPEWTEDELRDISRKMRDYIWNSMVAKRVARERVRFMEAVCDYPPDYLRPKHIEEKIMELRRYILKNTKIKKKVSNKSKHVKTANSVRLGAL